MSARRTPAVVIYFEPFRRWFDPAWGRPSIPIETYLRLMFLKYRSRLGNETLCAEVSDSLTWLRFCRIPIGESAPHPSTLMKLTTRSGAELIEELNARLLTAAVEAGMVDIDWLRADTTVVPADIKYPTDSGLLVRDHQGRAHRPDPGRRHRAADRLRRLDRRGPPGRAPDWLESAAPPGKTRRVSLADDDARPIRKGSLAKPTQFGYTAQVTDNRKGVVVDYEIAAGMPPDAPRLVPAIERAIAAVGGRARRRHRRSGLWRIVGR